MITSYLQTLELPPKCFLNKKLFKKHFYENFNFKSNDKKLFKNNIEQITWLVSIKPENTNIKAYFCDETEYSEIAYILVESTKSNGADRILEIIHRSIPYATLIFLCVEESFLVSGSLKRFSKVNKNEIIVDEIISTTMTPDDKGEHILNSLKHSSLNSTNLKEYYGSIISELLAHNTLEKIGTRPNVTLSPKEHSAILSQIEENEEKIISLKKKISQEVQLNRKVEMNVELKNIETIIIELKKQIN